MREKGPHGPIFMVNLLKFKERAEYEDGSDSHLSGREAYQRYSNEVSQLILKYGGAVFFVADITNLTLGLADEMWDEVAIAVYPNRKALFDMSVSKEWVAISHHRAAGLEGQINIESVTPPNWQHPDWFKTFLGNIANSS